MIQLEWRLRGRWRQVHVLNGAEKLTLESGLLEALWILNTGEENYYSLSVVYKMNLQSINVFLYSVFYMQDAFICF